MPRTYEETLELLENEIGLPPHDLFNYAGSPGVEEFQTYFDFSNLTLHNNYKFGITPSFFYYKDCDERHAKARKIGDNYIIEVNKGLVEFYNRILIAYFDLEDFDNLKRYQDLEAKLGNQIGELMYQSITIFTFYHELGHLIQFTDKHDVESAESLIEGANYSLELHCEELDSDLFASLSLSTHMYQYFEKFMNAEMNNQDVINYVSILTSTVYIYFLSFAEYRNGFYLKNNSHPHPIIRILGITNSIIGYYKQLLDSKGFNITINELEVFRETFRISEIFVNRFVAEKEFQGFFNVMIDNMAAIREYYEELVINIQGNPNSAINRRNELINIE